VSWDPGTIQKLFAAPDGTPPPVPHTTELDRIIALPRRPFVPSTYPDLTALFQTPTGSLSLRPLQSAMIWEATKADGLLANAGVGSGKTLVTLLLGAALQASRVLLLVPAHMREPLLQVELPFYAQHFEMPQVGRDFFVLSYEDISSEAGEALLHQLNPEWVICDEAHHLRNKRAIRTRTILRFAAAHPAVHWAFLSATLTTDSIKDYAHLADLALGAGSPLPKGHFALNDWAAALDVNKHPAPAGALKLLCNQTESSWVPPDVRSAFRRRLGDTPGVCLTTAPGCPASLTVSAVPLVVPTAVEATLADLRKLWTLDGRDIMMAMEQAVLARQVAQGFFYRWVWPGGIVDEDWKVAKSGWTRYVRDYLARTNDPTMDRPGKLEAAAMRRALPPDGLAAWNAWLPHAHKPEPPTVPVWLDKYVVDYADAWARQRTSHDKGIIWYEWEALGDALEALGWPVYRGGMDAALAKAHANVIVCSRHAHGEGKNLQRYHQNLVLSPPANGKIWEQLFGRTHREGQRADEVFFDVLLHTPENVQAWQSALADARYIQATTGQPQKLLYSAKCLGVPHE
jgi:hypothetical protein